MLMWAADCGHLSICYTIALKVSGDTELRIAATSRFATLEVMVTVTDSELRIAATSRFATLPFR